MPDTSTGGFFILRNRIVKEGFFRNYELGQLPPLARILFIGLWCLADKNGCLWDRPEQIKIECLPYDSENVEILLTSLANAGFILRYESKSRKCIQVVNFTKHQTLTSWEKNTSAEVPPQKNFRSTSKRLQNENEVTSIPLQDENDSRARDRTEQNSNEQKGAEQKAPFHGEEFLAALADYEQHRKEKRDPLKPTSRRLLYRKFELWGERDSTAAMLESIQNGWTGVFVKGNNNGHLIPSKSDRTQQAVENLIAKHERQQS